MAGGGEQAISWVMVFFIAALLGGTSLYALITFSTELNQTNVTVFVNSIVDLFLDIPTWLNLLMIVGFSAIMGLIGIVLYKRMGKATSGI